MIDQTQLENALAYLAKTDDESAELKARVSETEYLAKLVESRLFLTAEGSIDQKKAVAKAAEESVAAWDVHFKSMVSYEKIRAKRERAVIVVEVWRSMNANRRVGNV